jgi:thioredoxin-related protein
MRGSWAERWCLGLVGLTCALFLLGIPRAGAQSDRIAWQGYDEALRESQKSGRPIFIYFFIDNCVYCRRMDGQTLVNKKVVDYIKDSFIPVRVQAERSPQLAQKYMVRGFPTSFFLTPEGKSIYSLPGYLEAEEFAKVLRYIGGGHYRSQSLRDYLAGS